MEEFETKGRDKFRLRLALFLSTFGGQVAGVAHAGLLGWRTSLPLAVLLATLAGTAAGLVRGTSLRTRFIFIGPFLGHAVCLLLATDWYLAGREHVWTVELLIPFAFSLLPLVVGYRWARLRIRD